MVQVEADAEAGRARGARAAGDIDTILVVFPDLQGRLVGKRVTGHFWCEQMKAGTDGIDVCNYLLAVDSEMTALPGYEFANWDKGYGDFVCAPTWRRSARSRGSNDRARDVRPVRRGDRRTDRGVAPPNPATPGRTGRRSLGTR